MKQDHQKYIRECLARAIFHKVLDMEVRLSSLCMLDWVTLPKQQRDGPRETGLFLSI